MKILVLGSGAGGGYLQWNCNCELCAGVRRGTTRATPRTQSSIAVSADGERWVLLNASPDLGQQIRHQPALNPRIAPRDAPIEAVVLMDSPIDHVPGLLSLREGPPIELYCTPCVFEDLTRALPILPTLQHYCGVHWHIVPVAGDDTIGEFQIAAAPGLRFCAMAIAGKAPPYSPHREDPQVGDNIALVVDDLATRERLFYAPGLAHIGECERLAMHGASCVMVDGTFWTSDELIASHLWQRPPMNSATCRKAARTAWWPRSRRCPRGARCSSTSTTATRSSIEDSQQRRELHRNGIEVARDGMEIEL